MRISRKRRPAKPLIPRYNINTQIKAPEVRVLDLEDKNVGLFKTAEAIKMAEEKELDLVEINPKAEPPVCKMIDYSNFKYQKEKEVRKQKANSHVSEIKGIRLSIRISAHDLDVRRVRAEKFLNRGDKIKMEIMLRGRERGKAHLAYDAIRNFAALLEQTIPVKFEQEPSRQGGKVIATITKK
jgi:translation initiation factor IF-3